MTLTELGKRIRFFRKLRHMTLAALGRMLNVRRQAVARYEAGKAALPVLRIPALCAALHITPNKLFQMRPASPMDRKRRSRRVAATFRDLHRLMRCHGQISL
jgi:transcriptional regulator with XRE-family HTH domain